MNTLVFCVYLGRETFKEQRSHWVEKIELHVWGYWSHWNLKKIQERRELCWEDVSKTCRDPWTIACQAPLSIEFSRQEWSGLPFPTPGNLPHPWVKYVSPASPALAGWFFTTAPLGSIVNVRANTHTPVRLCSLPMGGEKSIILHWCSGVPWMPNSPGKRQRETELQLDWCCTESEAW